MVVKHRYDVHAEVLEQYGEIILLNFFVLNQYQFRLMKTEWEKMYANQLAYWQIQ
jgi:uncharacterized protein YqgQ